MKEARDRGKAPSSSEEEEKDDKGERWMKLGTGERRRKRRTALSGERRQQP